MLDLSSIQNTVMKTAEAITAAMGIETEIVDAKLKIIGGTGRYVKKIGSFEEEGNLSGEYIYAKILKTGHEYVCLDTKNDKLYDQMEGELAEISCPIQIGNNIIGIIGLVAFTEEQRSKMADNIDSLLEFLRRMSELIASKLIETQTNSKLALLLESMPEGLLAVDEEGLIFTCNFSCEVFLNIKRSELMGMRIDEIFPGENFLNKVGDAGEVRGKEVRYQKAGQEKRFFFNIVKIPKSGVMLLFEDYESYTRTLRSVSTIEQNISFDEIFGKSESIMEVKKRAKQVAANDSTVLITGESGTGKEIFARAIHDAGNRSDHMFVAINCAAIPDTLLESELFGYEKGAFTGAASSGKPGKFELANKGTVFLDEIGDMPLHLQVKILRVLQNKTIERVGGVTPVDIDVRIIAATNKDLEKMMEANEFREDLYFRLNVIPLHIPPLRSRPKDIEPFLMRSLAKFNDMLGKNIIGFEEAALEALLNYSWPGNVRELENVVEYSVNMESEPYIQLKNISDRVKGSLSYASNELDMTLKTRTEEAQRRIIESCLKNTGTSLEGKRKAAEILGISESTLYRKLRELGMKDIS